MDNGQEQNLSSYVRAVWRRGQTLHVTAGMLAVCRWGVPVFLVGVAIDWLTDLPAPGRVVILVTLLTVSVYKAWRCGWRHAGAFNATHTALRIEEHLGGLESLLVTAVQFRESELRPGTSASLRDLACRRAEEAVVPLRPEEAVCYHGLRRPATAVLILALIIGVFAVVNGPFLAAGVARIFAPWLAVSYPTRTQLDVSTGDMIVKEGGRVRIQAHVSGVIPSEATLALRTGTGKSREYALAIAGDGCEYTIKSVFRGFKYRISAGDAKSPWHTVEVISAPRVTEARTVLYYPEYTYPEGTDKKPETVEALTITVPEDTDIEWQLTLDRPIREGFFNSGDGKPIPLVISSDGRHVSVSHRASSSRAYRFSWVEKEHGFSFTSPRHHLQVMPDQRPHVELTSPRGNLYATLGRELDLAFRGRDDHGIDKSVVAYRVNKTEEVKKPFPTPVLRDGGEQPIDWDYRSVLTDLTVGDTVSFAVELTDAYPGPNGPHRARSEARRVTFLSREDYLEHIARQKRRLLLRLRAIYREERAVHDIVRRLDPSDAVFIQTCQLEAVRQDLMRERMGVLTRRMRDLIDDLAANNIPNETHTAMLVRLCSDMQTIADEHVGGAASSFRTLAAVSGNGASARAPDPAPAVHKVNTAARELGCLVLQLGYRDAAEVMARELHATAQTQASLRLQTIMPPEGASDGTEALSKAQERLAQWLSRLAAATPREKESTIKDALVAFNLSRLVKQLLSAGVDTKMREAVALIRNGGSADAARLQAEAIQALLHAEFRLRVGSEYEALRNARDLFILEASGQKALRVEIAALTAGEFNNRRSEFGRAQAALQRNLQLLLMPSVPAPRPRLFDAVPPSPPPVDDLLAAAEGAMKKAAAHMEAGDRDAAGIEQAQAEESFEALAEIVRVRAEAVTQGARVDGLVMKGEKQATKIGMLEERLLGLLEKTEDAAAERAGSVHLAKLGQALADDAEKFRMSIVQWNKAQATPGQDDLPLLDCLGRVVHAMTNAVPLLKDNQPGQAVPHQEAALDALEEAGRLIAEQTATHSAFAGVLGDAEAALTPSPQLADIEAEQRDMMAATQKAKPADLRELVIPQKNLVHAVDAVLNSLDVLAHKIESGSVMLFAKTDMDSAGVALAANDIEEAVDAQSYVADTLQELRAQIDAVTPQYRYVLEVTEFLHEVVPQSATIRMGLRQLREKMAAEPDADALGDLIEQQRALKAKAQGLGSQLLKLTGQQRFAGTARQMAEAIGRLEAGDNSTAQPQIEQAAKALIADAADLRTLMANLAYLIAPPSSFAPSNAEPVPEVKLVLDVLALAAQQKDLYRKTQAATAEQMAGFGKEQRELEKQCAVAIQASQSHSHLVSAKRHMAEAAAKLEAASRAEAVASQRKAGDLLRYFILEYVLEYVEVPPPAPPQDPAPSDDVVPEEDEMNIFMPGAVIGRRPKDGRVEWEVLGRRDRAALNENFARELPLEYRAILKDYYERLTK